MVKNYLLNNFFFKFRDEKKVICNKFAQNSSVTALIWPETARVIVGLLNGRVRNASTNLNKSATIYKTDSMVLSLKQQ